MSMLARLLLPLLLLAPTDPRNEVWGAMRAELDRAAARLRLQGYESPYFIGYTVRDYEAWDVAGKFGAVYQNQHARQRQTYVEVRVGDYQFDNFANESGGEPMFDMNDFEKYAPSTDAPIDNDVQALRGTLWLLTDYKYKRALAALNKKPTKHMDPPAQLRFDPSAWEVRVRKTTALLNKYPEIFDASMKVGADKLTRYIVNSEGSQIVTERVLYSVQLEAATRAADGMYLEHSKSFYGRTPEEMPSDAQLETAAKELASELIALRKAPMLDPYNGPAILLPQAAGVFFHEALGHRLEGERQNDEKEGATFKGQIGKPILPTFLTIMGDPSLGQVGKVSL